MSSGFYVFEDNTKEVIDKLGDAYNKGLNAIGLAAEGYAKQACPVDTGTLRRSITHKVTSDKAVYIGTAVEYGKYVECGTGQGSIVGGNPTITGMKARPFLKPAAVNHKAQYDDIMRNALSNA